MLKLVGMRKVIRSLAKSLIRHQFLHATLASSSNQQQSSTIAALANLAAVDASRSPRRETTATHRRQTQAIQQCRS
jgi:hypothetical protein